MVGSCSAYNCTNRRTPKGAENPLTFHVFPKDRMLLKKWIINMKRENWMPTKHLLICSRHFTPDSYEKSGWRNLPRLKSDAVPTIFDFPEHLQPPPKRPRQSPNKRKYKIQEAVDLLIEESVEQNANSVEIANVEKPKKPRLCYLRDLQKQIDRDPEAKPENFVAYTNLTEEILKKKNKQIKFLQQKTKRLSERLVNLQSLVLDLLEKNLTTDEMAQSIMV